MSRLGRLLVCAAVLVVVVGGTVTLIRDSNGDFSGDYALSGLFTKAGEGLPPGSEVVFRGVQVGRVSSATLHGDEARVTVLLAVPEPRLLVAVLTTETVLAILFETYAKAPSGVMATPRGLACTAIVAVTVLLAVLITETLLEPSFGT